MKKGSPWSLLSLLPRALLISPGLITHNAYQWLPSQIGMMIMSLVKRSTFLVQLFTLKCLFCAELRV